MGNARGMRSRSLAAQIAATAVAFALAGSPAAAEGFLDFYLGAGFVQNDTLHFRTDNPTIPIPTQRIASYDVSPSGGLRGGYWFEGPARFVGLGLDLSYYQAIEERGTAPFEFRVVPLTPLLMARLPLGQRDEKFPGGRFQPYVAIGPGLNLSFAHGDISELNVEDIHDLHDESFDVGLDVRSGLAVHLARRVGLFTEYRFTYFESDYGDNIGEFKFFSPDVVAHLNVKPTFATHHLVAGVSLRF